MSAYDAVAQQFDAHRSLPVRVVESIRDTVLGAIEGTPQPRLLEIGAGTGRIGRCFLAHSDDYVGLDLSSGMLGAFVRAAADDGSPRPCLVQADGASLPFRDETFHVVMLMHVADAARNSRQVIGEARRVLAPGGGLVFGHSTTPPEGINARMKRHLAFLLEKAGCVSFHRNGDDVPPWLGAVAQTSTRIVPARWTAQYTPRAFLERQRTGARFSTLPEAVQRCVLRELGVWAAATFGSIDAAFPEARAIELQVFTFLPEREPDDESRR